MPKKLFSEIPCLKGERVTLRALTAADADDLRRLTEDAEVYRYLPTFLFENKYEDRAEVIERLYDECLLSSLILGVFAEDRFCGLAEIYGYRPFLRKASVGYRLLQSCWGRGLATETLGLLVDYLLQETDVRIITASTMARNTASARVLQKNGFRFVGDTLLENWGYPTPILTKKWLKTGNNDSVGYSFQKEKRL